MTRPDPRLLVPVSVLPFVPDGARVIDQKRGPGIVFQTADRDAPMVIFERTGIVCWSPHFLPDGLANLFLDLSAPAKREGLDERLDVLPWALRVLGRPENLVIESLLQLPGPWNGLDLSNLTPDEQARAVVCAALRARGGSRG